MKVGTICKLKVPCLCNEAGTLSVVFNDYERGFQVIFENGNYDGFSTDEEITRTGARIEAEYFLEEIGFEESLAAYSFKNVMHVSADYRFGVFDIAWSENWKAFAAGKASVAELSETCLICGCAWSTPCEGSCYWVLPGLCSECVIKQVPDCIELLVDVVLETHQDEIDREHYGDKTPCSTCDLIKLAKKMVFALRQ